MRLYVRLSLFILVLLWFSGNYLLFLLPYNDSFFQLYPFLNLFYSKVCHQIPYKLISCNETHTLLCARCSGIYFGALSGSLYTLTYLPEFKTKILFLFLAGIPLIADIIFYSAGIYRYSHYAAFFTGVLFGTICFFYIFQGLNSLISQFKSGK